MNAVCRHFAPRPRIHATRLPHGRRAAATRGAASRSSRAPITVLSLPLSVADCGERWGSLPPRAAKHQPEMSRRSRPRLASGVLSGASRQPGRLEGAPRGNLARPAVPPESGDRPAWEVAAQGWTSISRSETLTSQTSQTVPGTGQQNPRAVEASLSLCGGRAARGRLGTSSSSGSTTRTTPAGSRPPEPTPTMLRWAPGWERRTQGWRPIEEFLRFRE